MPRTPSRPSSIVFSVRTVSIARPSAHYTISVSFKTNQLTIQLKQWVIIVLQFEFTKMMNDQNELPLTNRSFDNQPIGKNNKFAIPEYPENQNPSMVAQVVNPQPKPLAQRLKKNIQKIRREAVEELLGIVKTSPGEFEQHQHLTPQLLGGTDQIVMNNTLKIIVHYLSAGNSWKKDHKLLIKTLVQKCLCLQKDEIKSNSEQILYWFMDNKYEDLLLNELNQFLMNKNRKIVGTSIHCIAHLLNQYGIKRLKSLQLFYTSLELLSAPAKPVAKNQTVVLMKEAYRWVGQLCLSFYKIHMEVKEEIVKFGKDYQKVPMEIKRGLRKQPLKPGQVQKAVYHMQQEEVQNHEPVDVLNGYSSQWVDHVLKIQKWKQKKEQLQQFIKKTKVPCILPPRELSHFIFLIKKLLQENNINIFMCGLLIIQNLSKGLKKEFSHIAKNVLSQLYNKLKDTKPNIVEQVHTTLLTLLNTLHLEDFMEYIRDGLNDKSPLMKEETMKFLKHFMPKKDQKITNLIRNILDKLIQLTEDGAAKVRSQSLECLCELKIIHGMKFFGDKIKKLDPKKLQTIQLTKAPQNVQVMEIQQPITTVVTNHMPIVEKQTNTMKLKPSKSIPIQKSQLSSKGQVKNEQTSSVNSAGELKVSRSLNLNCLDQLSSSSEAIRNNAYQTLAYKFLSKDIKQFIVQIKQNSLRESSPTTLKNILQIAKKYVNNCVADIQITQFLIKHDWKKSKQMLTDFIQSNRFTQEADEALRSTNLLVVSNKVQNHQLVPTYTLKSFCIELQNSLITKMSSPIQEIKREAAENMILMWESIPKIGSQSELNPSNGWNEEGISRFFNIVKCRLIQSNEEIVTLYCRLLMEMMNKGVTAKYKHMKQVAQTIGNNLSKGCIELKKLYRQMVANAPHLMFAMMQADVCNELNRASVVEFIVENSQLFLKYADLKAYINPFLHILCATNIQPKSKQTLDSLFKQMIQISGTALLEKEISRLKVSNIQTYNQYLACYNVCLNKGNHQQVSVTKNYHLREDRLKYWEDEGWYGKITSTHILKLANLMNSLGQPLSGLCTLLYLTEQNISMLNSLQFGFLVQYSDIFFKFIYWRSIIDNKQTIEHILVFTSRLIGCVSYSITEIDLVLLLKSIINIVQRFRQIFYNQILSLFKKIFKINAQFQNNTFQFLINFLMENANPQSFVDEMLKIFMGCYEELLIENLVQLARIPTVHRNQLFMRYIQTKCDSQHLVALGFKVAISSKKAISQTSNKLLSDQGGPQNTMAIPASQIKTYHALFMLPSVVMTQRLSELTENMDPCVKMQTYVKILYSIITPFLKSEIHSINVHHFLSKLTKIIGQPYYTKKTYLRELTRMLLYLLIDLDECPPEGINVKEYVTIVNRCILTLIQTSEVRHMLQILFLFEKRQIELNQSSKITHLIIKCIGKAVKNNDFKQKMAENILFIINETNMIFNASSLPVDHSVVKTFKNILFFDLFRVYPISLSFFQEHIEKGYNLHPYLIQFYNDYLVANQVPHQTSEVPLKNHLKETQNMIRALGPATINKVVSMKKGEMNAVAQ